MSARPLPSPHPADEAPDALGKHPGASRGNPSKWRAGRTWDALGKHPGTPSLPRVPDSNVGAPDAGSPLGQDKAEALDWSDLIRVEPRLEALRQTITADGDRSWPAYISRKGQLQELVGWFALRRDLPKGMCTSQAFDVAFDVVMRGRW